MNKILEQYPRHKWIFLTLTVRNCEVSELRSTLVKMGKAWTRLTQRDFWPGIGWVKSVEVTRGDDGSAHPHFHALVMVRPSYFTSNIYVSQARWSSEWASALRVGYTPIVDVRRVKGDLSKALVEVVKYESKPADLSQSQPGEDPWLLQLQPQLHKMRAIAVGGCLKGQLAALQEEPEDLIGGDESTDDHGSQKLLFAWNPRKPGYFLVDDAG